MTTRRERSSADVSLGLDDRGGLGVDPPVSSPSSTASGRPRSRRRRRGWPVPPARHRANGAGSEKCRLTMGSRSRTATGTSPAVGHPHAELRRPPRGRRRRVAATSSPRSAAAPFTGLGSREPPRPRRLSGRLTTSATSCAGPHQRQRWLHRRLGVPRNTRRATGCGATGSVLRRGRSVSRAGRPVSEDRTLKPRVRLPADTSSASMAEVSSPRARARRTRRRLPAHVLVEPLDHEHAVEVIDLVLEHPAQELVRLDGDLVAVEVEPGERTPWAGRSRAGGRGSTDSPRRGPLPV